MNTVCRFFRKILRWFSRTDGERVSPRWMADREYRAGKDGFTLALACAVTLMGVGCAHELPTSPTPTIDAVTCEDRDQRITCIPASPDQPLDPTTALYQEWLCREAELNGRVNWCTVREAVDE